jgi:hypothetical protein
MLSQSARICQNARTKMWSTQAVEEAQREVGMSTLGSLKERLVLLDNDFVIDVSQVRTPSCTRCFVRDSVCYTTAESFRPRASTH